MKFNTLINKLNILLLAGIALNGISIQAMNYPLVSVVTADERREQIREDITNALNDGRNRTIRFNDEEDNNPRANIVTPYVNAAASFAVARYAPEIAEALMPRITPNYPSFNTTVPTALKCGGIVLGSHFLLKGVGVNSLDLLKPEHLKKAGKNTIAAIPNLAPAALCHPQVAQFAADCCTNLAASYVNESNLPTLNKCTTMAVMATGALSTLYLTNRNIFNGKLWKRVKRVCKDIRPYLFMAPLASAYNADTIKNYAMAYVPVKPDTNLHSDIGSGIKAAVYWGSLGAAAYLFATETLGIANQAYLKNHVNKLLQNCSALTDRLAQLKTRITDTQTKAEEVRTAQTEQNKALNEFADASTASTQAISGLVKSVSLQHAQSTQAVAALEQIQSNIFTKVKDINAIAPQIIEALKTLKDEHANKIAQLKATFKEQSADLLSLIAREDKNLEVKITALETACKAEATQMSDLNIKLTELLGLLKQEGQLYHMDQQRIENISRKLEDAMHTMDEVTNELNTLNAGHPAAVPSSSSSSPKTRDAQEK